MSWRPEGWSNPYLHTTIAGSDFNNDKERIKQAFIILEHDAQAYESGADAMLEALRSDRRATVLESQGNYSLISVPTIGTKLGKLVFIPDEEHK